MKRFAFVVVLGLLIAAPAAFAQNHGEIGAYADYVRLTDANNANFWGLGGRVGVNVAKHAQLEGEISYDFGKAVTTGSLTSGSLSVTRNNLRLLHGLFGFKVGTSGPVRVFVTAKGGFFNTSVSNKSILSGFTGAASSITESNTDGVFYPGGGIEGFLGPIGLRLDVGDLMYFDNGAHNNLRVTFGPQIRF
jgi:hypothetical protein